MITEDHLEQLALTWFQETGWSYLPAPLFCRHHDALMPNLLSADKSWLTVNNS